MVTSHVGPLPFLITKAGVQEEIRGPFYTKGIHEWKVFTILSGSKPKGITPGE